VKDFEGQGNLLFIIAVVDVIGGFNQLTSASNRPEVIG
jgi:hypothetical protein